MNILGTTNQIFKNMINPLNAELNPICHLLALLGAHPILHIGRIRVNLKKKIKILNLYTIHWIDSTVTLRQQRTSDERRLTAFYVHGSMQR